MANLIETEAALDEELTSPRPVLVDAIRELRSPLVILGAGGKMGPSLAVLARRAAEALLGAAIDGVDFPFVDPDGASAE